MEQSPEKYYSDILQHRGTAEVVLESGILGLINAVTLVGNTLLCIVIYKNKSLRTLTNIFIVFLAISDILMGIFCVPFSVAVFIQGKWVFGNHICRMQCFFVYFLAIGSLQTLTMIAVNRYYRVLKSSKYKKVFTFKSTVGILILVWLSTGLFLGITLSTKAVLPDFSPVKGACVMFGNPQSSSVAMYSVNMTLVTVFAIIPTVVISFSYFRVFRVVGNHFIRVYPTFNSRHINSTTSQLAPNILEIKSTRTLFFVLLAFAICWLPVFTIEVLQLFIDWWKLPRSCHLLWTFCGSLGTAVNPFVFGITCRTFRKKFLALLFSEGAKPSSEVSAAPVRASRFLVSEFSLAEEIKDTRT